MGRYLDIASAKQNQQMALFPLPKNEVIGFFFIVKEWLGSFKRILTFSCFKDQDSPGMRIIALVPISSSFYKWRDRL